jgi:hypothetical protein
VHDEAQVAQIAASIRECGWTVPILVDDDGGIIAGHGRLLAAQKLRIDTVPVMVATGWSEAQKRAYILADNKLTENASWDRELLGNELLGLQELGFELGLTGFSDDELSDLLAPRTVGLTDPDAAPPAPENPVSVLGDVWLLGRHRIVCGDSTDADDVAKALHGVTPHLMVTDPPYGVKYDPAWRQRAGVGGEGTATGVVLNDDRADWREAWALFPGSVAYVWHGGLHSHTVAESLAANRFQLRAQIVWVKTRHAMSRGHYHWQHEPAWYGVREGEADAWTFIPARTKAGRTGEWNGGRSRHRRKATRARHENRSNA